MGRMKSSRNLMVGMTFAALLVALGTAQVALERTANAQAKNTVMAPRFEVDPMWPKPLPNHWVYGNVIGVGIDARDHVYIIHRTDITSAYPTNIDRKEAYAALTPPASECCNPAPPVVEFDPDGNLVKAWGGPGDGYDWPTSNHGITVDSKGIVYIGGNGANDGHILKFTRDGKFIAQFGFPYANAGSNDLWAFNKVAKVFVDEANNEAYVADGYTNKRVAVIDTGKCR